MNQLAFSPHTITMMLIDASGSMEPFAADLEGSFNTYVRDLQAAAAPGYILLGVGSFSSLATKEEIPLTPVVLIKDAPAIRYTGDTPLYAAVASTLQKLLAHHPDPNIRIVLNVLTDGQDTCSKPSDLEWLRTSLVPAARARGFKLSVIGFGVDGETIAAQMGFVPGASISVPRSRQGMATSFRHMTMTTLT